MNLDKLNNLIELFSHQAEKQNKESIFLQWLNPNNKKSYTWEETQKNILKLSKIIRENIKWKRKPYKLSEISKINTFNKNSSNKLKKLVRKATEYYPFGPYLSDGKKITKVKIKRKNHIF